MASFNENKAQLIEPYGGTLVNLLVPDDEREIIMNQAAMLPRLQLTTRNLCDLELLASGGFSGVFSAGMTTGACSQRCVLSMTHSFRFPLPWLLNPGPIFTWTPKSL
jgi:sulfate adenylyltransferase